MSDAKFDGADMSEVVMSKAYAVGASFKALVLHVSRVSDVESVGQELSLKCIRRDVRGNIKMSLKDTHPLSGSRLKDLQTQDDERGGGFVLEDNIKGGATWAFEVGTRSMICPIIVEDLNPPRQLLVEMLCEDRGFFLEIADLVRGLGLTILKGVLEARKDRVWARFAVEANKDVTRMEVFLSLACLFDPNGMLPSGVENLGVAHNMF